MSNRLVAYYSNGLIISSSTAGVEATGMASVDGVPRVSFSQPEAPGGEPNATHLGSSIE